MKQLLIALGFSISLPWNALGAPQKGELSELQAILNKIQKAVLVEIQTKRTVTSDLMGTETVYEGTLSLSKKLFRWDHSAPDRSMILFDGKTFWSVQYPEKGSTRKMNVAKSMKTELIQKQNGISLFVGNSQLKKSFKKKASKDIGNQIVLELEAVKPDPQLQNLKIAYDKKLQTLNYIEFVDEIGNQTRVDFLSTKMLSKIPKKFFEFNPPPEIQVTEL